MKKTVLISLSVAFFLTPICSYFSSHALTSMCKKINQPVCRISLGLTSMILLQFFNKKSIPGLRIPQYIKETKNTIEKKEQERKGQKIMHLFQACDFMDSAIATFNKYGYGDAFAEKKENLVGIYNRLIKSKENLNEKISNFYLKKITLGDLNFKNNAGIPELKENFFEEDNAIENCAIDTFLVKTLETIDREEELQNNFFYRLLFHNFTEKIKYLLILGELQLILFSLPFIYKKLNKKVED